MNTTHTFKFFRAGGFDQVRLDSGADLVNLEALDQKLWVALACPTRGVELDSKTLDLIDTDKDGRIRPPEILEAVKWAVYRLRNPEDLVQGNAALPLESINDSVPEGAQVLSAARQILVNLNKPNETVISLENTADTKKLFAETRFNGDGIVTAESADDEATKKVIGEIIDCLGSLEDRSGKPGIDTTKLDAFFADAQALSDHHSKAETEGEAVLPLGDKTAAAHTALLAVRAKIDDYFARCRLAAFDPRATAPLNLEEAVYATLAPQTLTSAAQEAETFPLARVEAYRPLPLKDSLNPAWAERVATLFVDAVVSMLGDRETLTEGDWKQLKERLAAHDAWASAKPSVSIEKLGLHRVREILASKAKDVITELIAKDKALEPEANAIADVDKLIRYHANLHRLLNNFVSFRDFYSRREKAIFQAGRLFIDGKSIDLVLTVEDAAKHGTMAGLAATYLLYCDCLRKGTNEKLSIVAAVTAGDTGDLMIGRNGVFYDRQGRDWDATVTKIIDNPIGIRQAFWSPYKKFVRAIEETVQKRAQAAEAASQARLQGAATGVATADKPPAKPPEPKKMDIGTVAAIGVAVGAIGTAISAFATGILQLSSWQIPLVFVGIMLLISGPSMLIACLKLRRRNLAPILDANGWAVNTRARVNIPFGSTLTGLAALPKGAERSMTDPYAEKKSPWPKVVVALVVLFIAYKVLDNKGKIYEWTKGWIGTPPAASQIGDAIEKVMKK